MTRDELFDLAEKAGLGFIRHASDKDVNKFEQLAALVASAEREWVGLTNEDKNEILVDAIRHEWNDRLIVEQIEAKLKEKNT